MTVEQYAPAVKKYPLPGVAIRRSSERSVNGRNIIIAQTQKNFAVLP